MDFKNSKYVKKLGTLMGLDMIEQKNLDDLMTYTLEYPKMVLVEAKTTSASNLEDFACGLYIGYICGVFFDGFLQRNKRYLDLEESSDFHDAISKRMPEIRLKVRAHLHLK